MKFLSMGLAVIVIIIGIFFLMIGASAPVAQSQRNQMLSVSDPIGRSGESDMAKQFKLYFRYLDQKEANTIGAVQVCTGWILVGLGLTTIALIIQRERRALQKLHKEMIR